MTERNMQLEDWLDDLCARFILNLPLADLESIERICFQVEEAQWFYEDFIRPLDPALPSMSLRRFCERIFAHCPLLSAFSQGEHMQAFEQFMEYKARIPVRGAILLNDEMDSAVLVKGWKKGANWSFPRGKINKDEDDLDCAVREVYEETGYNLEEAGLVPADRNVKRIEVNMRDQQMQLFVFRDVPMDTYFEPRTRKEISKIQWWRLSDLPAFRKKAQQNAQAAVSANKFYMVAPFLVPLRKWVVEEKKKDAKRVSSNQYLSGGMSHDELFTEEDRGAESAGPVYFKEGIPRGMPNQSSLEDASAALNRLLKIQQSHELQAEPPLVPQPVNKVGDALLAILHNKSSVPGQPPANNAPPQTPLDHTLDQPQMPTTPHHFQPRPPHFSNMPPPPMFPIQPQPGTFSYQQPNIHNQYRHHNTPQSTFEPPQPAPKRNGNPHSHQSPHLVHPQPLPPNVQRAVFTGGPVHAPMVPPPQHYQPQANASMQNSMPLFPGLHSTMVPPEPKHTPPKLTSHSLALLNAFKNRDQAIGEPSSPRDLPLKIYAPESPRHQAHPMPHELPADLYQEIQHSHRGQPQNGNQGITPPTVSTRPAISETQKSTLLGLFKSPTTKAAMPAGPLSATALPPSIKPSAVELSAVEPLSATAATTSALLNDKRVPDQAANIGTKLALPSGSQLPFRPTGILARPLEVSEDERITRDSPGSRIHPKSSKAAPSTTQDVQQEKPVFQPQILKRPQPVEPVTQQPSFPPYNRATIDRPSSKPEHTQDLLSLFGKLPPGISPTSQGSIGDRPTTLPNVDPASRSTRVGSLASTEGPRRGSQIPMSPADTGFLLNYLDAVANGSQR